MGQSRLKLEREGERERTTRSETGTAYIYSNFVALASIVPRPPPQLLPLAVRKKLRSGAWELRVEDVRAPPSAPTLCTAHLRVGCLGNAGTGSRDERTSPPERRSGPFLSGRSQTLGSCSTCRRHLLCVGVGLYWHLLASYPGLPSQAFFAAVAWVCCHGCKKKLFGKAWVRGYALVRSSFPISLLACC